MSESEGDAPVDFDGVGAYLDDDADDEETKEPLGDEFRTHVMLRTIVLPEHKVLYMPTSKAACTTLLWQLAYLSGQDAVQFEGSDLPGISTALTIHDMGCWAERFRFSALSQDARAEVLSDPTWFRFTTVRNPASRVWSAWQSKLLLREPRFVADWIDRDWFPRVPASPQDVIDDYRAFVRALAADPGIEDVHWTLQSELFADFPFTFIGRTEALPDTIAALQQHLETRGMNAPLQPGRDNRTPLRLPPGLYDEETAEALNSRYLPDFEAFDYPPARAADEQEVQKNAAWVRATKPLLPLLADIIDHNERIGQLSETARVRKTAWKQERGRTRRAEVRLEALATRRSSGPGPMSPVITNLQQHSEFNVRWAWGDEEPLQQGFTAIVRVKNEAKPLPFVLPPLLRAVRNVVLVDNGSTDGTPDLAREIADREGRGEQLRVTSYPFDVARCGPDHLGTEGRSLHSLTYFYNWSFSQVRSTYALKWDGDMVLTETGVAALRDLDWQLEASERIVTMPRYPLYVADDRTAFLDIGLANNEPWGWPNRPGYVHVKAIEWELPLWPEGSQRVSLPDWTCLELKWLDADEFAHWSTTDFTQTKRTQRKQRELAVHEALNNGTDPPAGVVAVHAPEGENVIDFVRRRWLIDNQTRLAGLLEELKEMRRAARKARRKDLREQIRAWDASQQQRLGSPAALPAEVG